MFAIVIRLVQISAPMAERHLLVKAPSAIGAAANDFEKRFKSRADAPIDIPLFCERLS
jgi:hypothetical protein